MTEQETYLSKDHSRLLSIAGWARYLAWAVLVIFAVGAILSVVAQVNVANYQLSSFGSRALSLLELFREYPSLAINSVFAGLRTFFQGVVYFLVLKGISLGLSMIAETDVNYRDRSEGAR